MDYFTDTDKIILLAGGLGLGLGLIITAQELGLDWWLKKEWVGWDRAVSRAIVSAIVWALLLSAANFLSILYQPMKPLAEIQQETLQWCVIGPLLPVTTRAGLWAFDKIGRRVKPNSGQ